MNGQELIVNYGECIQIEYIQGDIDFDGQVNIVDILILIEFILGDLEFNDCEFTAVDLDQNEVCNITDIVNMVQLILNSEN